MLAVRAPARESTRSPEPSTTTRQDAALDAFMARGLYGPAHVRPPTGVGGFQVAYAPAAGVELIRIGAGVRFLDAVLVRGDRVSSDLPALRKLVRQINAAPPSEHLDLVRPYQWTPAARAAWLVRLERAVEQFWSGVFRFRVKRPGWEALSARTAVDVDVREGPKAADDHLAIDVTMVPDDHDALVRGLGSGHGPLDNRMVLGASDVGPRSDNMLEEKFEFRADRTSTSDMEPVRLTMLGNRFRSGTEQPPPMTWYVQGDGAAPEASAKARFDSISFHMVAEGFDPTRLRFAYDGTGQSARAVVGAGMAQNAAVHEFGHVLGLKDEYARDRCAGLSGTGKPGELPAGKPSAHDALARQMGLPGSVHENNEGLMSFGNLLRPSYAATSLWALRRVTGVPDWVSQDDCPASADPVAAGSGQGS